MAAGAGPEMVPRGPASTPKEPKTISLRFTAPWGWAGAAGGGARARRRVGARGGSGGRAGPGGGGRVARRTNARQRRRRPVGGDAPGGEALLPGGDVAAGPHDHGGADQRRETLAH